MKLEKALPCCTDRARRVFKDVTWRAAVYGYPALTPAHIAFGCYACEGVATSALKNLGVSLRIVTGLLPAIPGTPTTTSIPRSIPLSPEAEELLDLAVLYRDGVTRHTARYRG